MKELNFTELKEAFLDLLDNLAAMFKEFLEGAIKL